MLSEILTQRKVSRVRSGGIFHSFFFWGFMILFAGTLLVMLQADFLTPVFEANILQGNFYRAFSLVLDIAGAVGAPVFPETRRAGNRQG
jgi:hypothetical protein